MCCLSVGIHSCIKKQNTVKMDQAISKVSTLLIISLFTQSTAVITRKTLLQQQQKLQYDCTQLIIIDGVYAFKEKIADVNGIPADIRVHWKTDTIYFTLVSNDMKMSLQSLRSSGDLETIKVAGLGQSSTVDNLNDIVYLGTDNGVYKYKEDGNVEQYAAMGEDVMYLAVNAEGNTMYIATWPQNRVYKINGETQALERFTKISNGHGLTLDPRNNMYFVDVSTETLYVLKSGEKVPRKVRGLRSDKMVNVFVSRSDVVYAMDDGSNIYKIDVDREAAKYVRNYNISGVNTFGVDSSDNVIIGVKGAIYKFSLFLRNPCNVLGSLNPNLKAERRKKRQKKATTTTTTTEYYEDADDDDDDDE